VTFFPLLTGVVLLAVDGFASTLGSTGLPPQVWRGIGLGSALFTFLLSLLLWAGFDATETAFQFVEYAPWLPQFGVHYFAGIDGISLLLIILTTFLMPLVLLGSWNEIKKSLKSYIFFMLFLETGMIGTFAALNLFQFYVFWELMLIPMYFIIGVWGGPRRIYAAIKFFLFTMFGSLLMLVALLVIYYLHFEQFGFLNLDLVAAPGGGAPAVLDTVIASGGETVWWKTQPWLFAAFALAFGIKVPMVPFHTWLPDVRFALPLFPVASVEFAPVIFTLALIGILYGALVAMVQSDVKKLVAYSSVAHLGFVMLGMFALNAEGLEGSIIQMVNHGVSTGGLFLLVGMIYERRHTREIADFGGIAKPMPVYAGLFGIVVMSSVGLPMLNGFVGEFLILLGTFKTAPLVAVAATLGVILAAVYLLWMFRRVMFGPVENPENRGLIDLGLREKVILVTLLIPIFWIGIYPDTFLRRLHPPVLELLRVMESKTAQLAEADPAAGAAASYLAAAISEGERR
jgi:NADH-quinone oxidoreductase subunit M